MTSKSQFAVIDDFLLLICLVGNNLYLGTSDGFLLHYIIDEKISSESVRLIPRDSKARVGCTSENSCFCFLFSQGSAKIALGVKEAAGIREKGGRKNHGSSSSPHGNRSLW